MPKEELEPELEGSNAPHVHPSAADLERFMHNELEDAEHQVVVRHLRTGCEKCRSVTARLWNHGARDMCSLIEALASPKALARHRRRARSKKWDPRMSAAVASLESVAREILREYLRELEETRDGLEILAAGLARVPVKDPEKLSTGEELQAAIACVLQDNLGPAIAGLHAAVDSAAELDEEGPETA